MSSPRPWLPRRQWTPARTFLSLIVTLAVAAFAWWVGGYLAMIVVLVVGLLITSYFGTVRFSNWQTGRPSRIRREIAEGIVTPPEDVDAALRTGPDAVEDWLHERVLDDKKERHGESG